METEEGNLIPDDVMADAQLVADSVAVGRPIPEDVVRRVGEGAGHISEDVFLRHGPPDIGMPAVRELRDA